MCPYHPTRRRYEFYVRFAPEWAAAGGAAVGGAAVGADGPFVTLGHMTTGGTGVGSASASRSTSRTSWFPYVLFCPECANDWGVYGLIRKSLVIIAFFLMATALYPEPREMAPGATEVRMEDMSHRLDRLDRVPEDLATIRVELIALQTWQKETSDQITKVVWGLLALLGVKTAEAFGVKISARRGTGV